MNKGKLIVIDGGDGAGKKTQTKLLVERLSAEGYPTEVMDFPQYDNNLFGRLIQECLAGKRGNFLAVDPHIASVLYAADRFESKAKIEGWLAEGKTVVLDRYVSSNMLHQGGKIEDSAERQEFINWLDQMEHEVLGSPRPDLIIYCSMDPKMRMELLAAEAKETAIATDVAENDLAHQEQTDKAAEQIVAMMNNWRTVECMREDGLRSIEDIHGEIFEVVKEVLT